MPLELGAAFTPRPVEVYDPEPRQIDVESLRAEQLLTALAALQDALNNMPAPVVNVSEPDLSAIVTAVNGLKGNATPEEIATAVVNQISPGGEPEMNTVLNKLVEALDRLDFRMKGLAGTGGGGGGFSGTVDISSRTDREVGRVSVPDGVTVPGGVNVNNFPAVMKTDDDESQGLLTTIRDTVARRTDTLVTTSTVSLAATSQDRAWLAGTGRVTLNVAGNLRIVLANTSATMPILLLRIAGLATATGWAQVLRNPTAGVPATAPRPNQNARFGSSIVVTTPLEVRVDTSAATPLSGGTDTGLVLGIPGGTRTSIDLLPLRIDPGQTVGINVPFAGAADAALSVYWMNAA